MAKSFQIFLFYYDIPRDPIFIQQYYLVSINQDMNLQREVNNEPHRLTFPNDRQDSDSEGSNSEGSSNYTLAPTHPVMPPPPDMTFQTREELVNSAKMYAAQHGYALVIRTSRPGKLWLKCDRGEKYRNRLGLEENQRKRKTGTRLIGCYMEVIGKEKNGLWEMYTKEATHNHEPSSDTSAHPSLRRLTNEQIQTVQRMTKAGQAPRAIWAVLNQEYSELNIKMSDLYNLRGNFRTQGLGARTSIQAFLQAM